MKTVHLLKKLGRFPLFTENDAAKIVNKGPKYIRTLLYRLNKEKLIYRIERGKYTLHEDTLIFASHIAIPSYLSLWTALRYYNMTEQQPTSFFVLSPIKRKNIKNLNIIFASTKHIFGYKKERYSDFDIFIAEPEKTIIDSLLFKIPIEDINRALDNKYLDFKKLSNYAKKTKNKSLIKRMGYLLEKKKNNPYGLKALDNNYILFDYMGKKKGKRDKRWKLMINNQR